MKLLQIFIFLTFFYSCKNTNSSETPKHPTVEVDTLTELMPEKEENSILYAAVDELRLRKEPGAKGVILEKVKEGGVLIDLQEATAFKEKIKLRDQWFEEPWLKVESEKGNVGWVFGGAVTKELPKEVPTKMPYDICDVDYMASRNYQKRFKCYQKVANQQLSKDARYIKKTETGFLVTLLSGETRNLVDDKNTTEEGIYREYEYRYYLEKLGYFVFRINRYEAGDYILMDDKYGYVTSVNGMPKISPDLKKIVTTNADGAAGFEFNGIQLLEMSDGGLKSLFNEEIEGFEPHHPVWVDEKTIEIDFLPLSANPKGLKAKAKLTEEAPGVWNLTIGNAR